MGGSNAESFYKIPESFKVKVNKIIPKEMKDVINKFYNIINFFRKICNKYRFTVLFYGNSIANQKSRTKCPLQIIPTTWPVQI